MTKLLTTALALLIGLYAPDSADCGCTSATSEETTRWGGNEWVISKEQGTYRTIHGVVDMPLPELREDVLVEVFDQPDYLLCEWDHLNPNNCTINPPDEQRRIAACKTGKDGEFCFENIPAGKYELRVSKNGEWSPTHVYVVVDPDNPKSTTKPIEVGLNIGI